MPFARGADVTMLSFNCWIWQANSAKATIVENLNASRTPHSLFSSISKSTSSLSFLQLFKIHSPTDYERVLTAYNTSRRSKDRQTSVNMRFTSLTLALSVALSAIALPVLPPTPGPPMLPPPEFTTALTESGNIPRLSPRHWCSKRCCFFGKHDSIRIGFHCGHHG